MRILYQKHKFALTLIVILGLLALNYNLIQKNLNHDFFGIFGSILLFIFGSRKTNCKVQYFLVPIILICQFISYRLHTQSLHFLSIILFLCLLYYYFTQKFSYIAFICLLLFSTLFNKFSEHLTTEIKQSLCQLVYHSLKNWMAIDKIEGVNFYINHARITIDTACMGLSMFKTGLLTAAFILTLEEQKQKKYFSPFLIFGFSVVVVVLNIVSNYFRIIALLVLHCTQANTLHHSIGLMCFVLYQVLPMLLIIRFFRPKTIFESARKARFNVVSLGFTFSILIATSYEIKKEQKSDLLLNLNPKYPIAQGNWVTPEVYKMQTKQQLIYIKTPSHKPLICWTGSGYAIIESEEIVLENQKIWSVKMEKNNIRYQSLWWYESGEQKYSSFLEIMCIKLLYNQPVRLINITKQLD